MLRLSRPTRSFLGAIAIATLAVVASAQAALLTLDGRQRIGALVSSPVDLTVSGSLDWAYWSTTSGTLISPFAPTNDKNGGTAISSASIFGGGTGLRGSGSSTTVERYSFTDGTSPGSGTNASLAGLLFNGDLGSSGGTGNTGAVGKGFQLTIAGDPLQERLVTLYLGGFASTSSLTLSLNGIAVPLTVSDAPAFPNSSPKQMDIYTLRFKPDSASDLLQVQYIATSVSDVTNGHVGLQAVTVAAVPEPGAVALLGLGGLALARRRRR